MPAPRALDVATGAFSHVRRASIMATERAATTSTARCTLVKPGFAIRIHACPGAARSEKRPRASAVASPL